MKSLSRVQLFATPWTVAHQAPLSMGFSRQGYWSGLPFPSPGNLPHPGVEPRSPTWQADALTSEPPGKLNHQAPPSMGFSRQEYWSGLPFPSPADLPNPGIEPGSPHCRQTLNHLSHQMFRSGQSDECECLPHWTFDLHFSSH